MKKKKIIINESEARDKVNEMEKTSYYILHNIPCNWYPQYIKDTINEFMDKYGYIAHNFGYVFSGIEYKYSQINKEIMIQQINETMEIRKILLSEIDSYNKFKEIRKKKK